MRILWEPDAFRARFYLIQSAPIMKNDQTLLETLLFCFFRAVIFYVLLFAYMEFCRFTSPVLN